jgi:Concanavalin A-like lectin/glucanases superfamily
VKPQGNGIAEPFLFKEKPSFGAYALYYGLVGGGDLEGLIGDEGQFVRAVDGADQEKNVWLHIALTYDGAQMRLYVNAELIDTVAAHDVEPSSGDLSIGCSEEFGDNFKGLIDEVRIYNRALGAGEVAADMGAGLQTPSRTPLAAYSLDAGEGTVAEDLFGQHTARSKAPPGSTTAATAKPSPSTASMTASRSKTLPTCS